MSDFSSDGASEVVCEVVFESIENPHHRIPEDLEAQFAEVRQSEFAENARRDRISQLGFLGDADEQELRLLYETAAREAGVGKDTIARIREIHARPGQRLRDGSASVGPVEAPPVGAEFLDGEWPSVSPRADNHFWWAKTNYWAAPGMSVDLGSNGVRWKGQSIVHTGDKRDYSFGLEAFFELQPNRRPPSVTDRWSSAPYATGQGKLRAHCGSQFAVDCFSKVHLHRQQTLYQPTFGGLRILAEDHWVELGFLDVEADFNTIDRPLYGHMPFPPLVVRGVPFPDISIWARIKVEFHVELKGAGSALYAAWDGGPYQALIYTPQWPFVPNV